MDSRAFTVTDEAPKVTKDLGIVRLEAYATRLRGPRQGTVDPSAINAFSVTEPEVGYEHIVFDRNAIDWRNDYCLSPAQRKVLEAMKDTQRLSIVRVKDYATSLRGPRRGTVHPTAVLNALEKPGLLSSFGNYVLWKNCFRAGNKGFYLGGKYYKMPVGKTSLSKHFAPIEEGLQEHFLRREQTDGSFGHMGISLNKAYVIPKDLDFRLINGRRGLNEYYALTPERKKIDNVVWESLRRIDEAVAEVAELRLKGVRTTMSLASELRELEPYPKSPNGKIERGKIMLNFGQGDPHNPHVRSSHSMYAGSLAHGSQGNERSAKLVTKAAQYDIALTCPTYGTKRDNGMLLDEWQHFSQNVILPYLGVELDDVLDFYNTDGASNIIQALRCSDGSVKILAKGGLGDKPLPSDLSDPGVRNAPNYLLTRRRTEACQDVGRLRDPEFDDDDDDKDDSDDGRVPLQKEPNRLVVQLVEPELRYSEAVEGGVNLTPSRDWDVEGEAKKKWHMIFMLGRD